MNLAQARRDDSRPASERAPADARAGQAFSFRNHPDAGQGNPGGDQVSTQAFFKKDGGIWQYEHWSNGPADSQIWKSFCLDVKAERLVDLVIAMSNNDPSADVTGLIDDDQPQLAVSNVGCWQYKGTTTVEQNFSGPTGTFVSTTDATVTFVRYRPPATPDGVPGMETFVVDNGTVTGSSTQMTAGCTITGDGSGAISPGPLSGSLQVLLGLDTGVPTTLPRFVSGLGIATVPTHREMACGTGQPVPIDGAGAWNYLAIPASAMPRIEVQADGTIVGTYQRAAPPPSTGMETDTWALTPQRQP